MIIKDLALLRQIIIESCDECLAIRENEKVRGVKQFLEGTRYSSRILAVAQAIFYPRKILGYFSSVNRELDWISDLRKQMIPKMIRGTANKDTVIRNSLQSDIFTQETLIDIFNCLDACNLIMADGIACYIFNEKKGICALLRVAINEEENSLEINQAVKLIRDYFCDKRKGKIDLDECLSIALEDFSGNGCFCASERAGAFHCSRS